MRRPLCLEESEGWGKRGDEVRGLMGVGGGLLQGLAAIVGALRFPLSEMRVIAGV